MHLAGNQHPIWDSRRLWSLAEMINFYLYNFVLGQQFLRQALQTATDGVASRQYETVSPTDHERIAREVRETIKFCVEAILLYEAGSTAIEIENMLGSYPAQHYNWRELHTLLVRLRDQIEREIAAECFFHYDRGDARALIEVPKAWAPIISSFPSSRREIETALDCRALSDYVGCVFHMMRVAELGLRSVAGERGIKSLVGKRRQPKPIEWGTWQEVFDAIQGRLKDIRTANPGPKRDAALSFYDTALSDLQTLRGLYRDPTMHFRERYDAGEAYSAIFRTKSLMTVLATRLNETAPRKIRWGL